MQDRMKKIYYNCEITNPTTSSIEAKYSAGLLKPIIDNPLKYNINVNRFRLPLNGVPLSRNNIPFQQWQASLGYFDPNSNQWQYSTNYVPQYNPKIVSGTYAVVITSDFKIQKVDNSIGKQWYVVSEVQLTGVTNLSNGGINVKPSIDNYQSQQTILILGSDGLSIKAFDVNGTLLKTLTFGIPISGFFSSNNGNILIVSVYSPSSQEVYLYKRGNVSTWTLTDTYSTKIPNNPNSITVMMGPVSYFNNNVYAAIYSQISGAVSTPEWYINVYSPTSTGIATGVLIKMDSTINFGYSKYIIPEFLPLESIESKYLCVI